MPLAQIGAVIALALSALPPPPETVVFETKMYGTVTLDHRAHLARRVACRSCHGEGPVRKLAGSFGPKVAHDRCRGCHLEISRGPTDCRGCHVKPPPPPVEVAAAPLEEKAVVTVASHQAGAAAVQPIPGPAVLAPGPEV